MDEDDDNVKDLVDIFNDRRDNLLSSLTEDYRRINDDEQLDDILNYFQGA